MNIVQAPNPVPSDNRLLKLGFELSSADGFWPPVDGEWLWFEPLTDSLGGPLKLVNVPFFVTGLALEDLIRADIDETSTIKSWALIQPSGNDLIWLLRHDADLWTEIDQLCELGCRIENYQDYHFAVSVPSAVESNPLDEILHDVEAKQGQVAFPVWRRGEA